MDNKNNMISVIVPVYNTEKYLKKCLNSILAQTLQDWECILIDDGSTDTSGKICDEYAEKDSRFQVIHQKNSGVSVARNKGLDIAKGDWIGFVDSDDWIEPETYEIAVKSALENDADLVQWQTFFENENFIKLADNSLTDFGIFSLEDCCKCYDVRSVCNKIISRRLFTDYKIKFSSNLKYGEDTFVSIKLLSKMNKGINLNKSFYHYVKIPTSKTHTIKSELIINQAEAILQMNNFLKEEGLLENENVKKFIQQLKYESKSNSVLALDFSLYRSIFPELRKYMLFRKQKNILIFWLLLFHLDFLVVPIIKIWMKRNGYL